MRNILRLQWKVQKKTKNTKAKMDGGKEGGSNSKMEVSEKGVKIGGEEGRQNAALTQSE